MPKLYAHIVKERSMPVDFKLEEMRAIPGSANTAIREHQEHMLSITYGIEHLEQLPAFKELIIRAIMREHKHITSITFLTPAEAEEYTKRLKG